MSGRSFFPSWPRRYSLRRAPLALAVIILGTIPPLCQASGQQSNSSGGHLTTWNRLSEKFDETLSQHELTLRVLLKNLEASESNGERLTRLSGELSRQNEDLRSYNGQIGERMQERDEELAGVYEDLEGYKRLFRKALIVIAVMGAYILIPLVIKVCRFLKVIPI